MLDSLLDTTCVCVGVYSRCYVMCVHTVCVSVMCDSLTVMGGWVALAPLIEVVVIIIVLKI